MRPTGRAFGRRDSGAGRSLVDTVLVLSGFAAVLASRALMIGSPYFEEIQYERAPMGLEALAILRGETPVMNWSEPYHGTVFSYLLAPFYAWFSDPILTYSWVSVALNLLGTAAVFAFACQLWGRTAGLAALVYLALAPAFFPFYDVNSYALFVTLGGLAMAAALRHLSAEHAHARWAWACGILLGTAVWCHQLSVCFAAAVGLAFLVEKRVAVFRGDAWRLALGFALGAAPILAWNADFHWIVLRNFVSPDYASRPVTESVQGFWESIGSLLAANGQFWTHPETAGPWMVVGQAIFVLLFGFAVIELVRHRREPGALRAGSCLLVVLMTLTAILYSKSRWGVTAGFSRYLIPMCFPVPILVGGLIATLARRSRGYAAALLAVLVIPGLHDRWQYAQWGAPMHDKGARTGVAALERLGITRAYAHDRISLPLTLASRERIIVSDYYGIPYAPYLDAVDDAASPAIVAHKTLKIPSPEDVARSLPVLHGTYRKAEADPYVIFYDFQPPALTGGYLPSKDWKLDASVQSPNAGNVADRDPLTVWSTDRRGRFGDWLSIDLGAVHRVNEVHLLSGVRTHDTPGAALVETSLDGKIWTERARLLAVNWYWWNGHPKHDDLGRASFYFEPAEARWVRIRLLAPTDFWNWSVAEAFVRAADVSESDAGALEFRRALLAERRGFIGINYHTIHAQYAPDADTTDWGEVMADYQRALRANPDHPDYAYRYGRALWLNGFLAGNALERDGVRFERLGLTEAAAKQFAGCAVTNEVASLCVERAIAAAPNDEERAKLETIRKQRFEPATALEARFGDIALRGAGVVPAEVKPGASVPLDLFWRCERTPGGDYGAFVHIDGPGHFRADHAIAGGTPATSDWIPGETIRDRFTVEVPKDAPPGDYVATVGVWDPHRHRRMRSGWFGASETPAFTLRVAP